jgi:hypothetical protein
VKTIYLFWSAVCLACEEKPIQNLGYIKEDSSNPCERLEVVVISKKEFFLVGNIFIGSYFSNLYMSFLFANRRKSYKKDNLIFAGGLSYVNVFLYHLILQKGLMRDLILFCIVTT